MRKGGCNGHTAHRHGIFAFRVDWGERVLL